MNPSNFVPKIFEPFNFRTFQISCHKISNLSNFVPEISNTLIFVPENLKILEFCTTKSRTLKKHQTAAFQAHRLSKKANSSFGEIRPRKARRAIPKSFRARNKLRFQRRRVSIHLSQFYSVRNFWIDFSGKYFKNFGIRQYWTYYSRFVFISKFS